MVSGSYKGASLKIDDVLVIGALAVGGYFLYKTVIKPTSDVTNTAADVFGRGGEAIGSGFDIWNTIFDKINDKISGFGADTAQPVDYNNVNQVSFNDYVTKVETTGTAYNMPVVTATTSSGKKSSVIAAPKTYYSNLGIGFDQYGQGYSAAMPVSYPNKAVLPVITTKTATPTTTTKTTTATSIFTKKPYT